MSLGARLVLLAVLVVAIAAGWWRITVHYDAQGYTRAKAEDAAAAQAQADRNRELQRGAELRYTVQGATRDRFIVQTRTEIRHATESLASCPVPADARRLLNDAAACARDESAAVCGAGQPVPAAP